jgi:hypothetical protein
MRRSGVRSPSAPPIHAELAICHEAGVCAASFSATCRRTGLGEAEDGVVADEQASDSAGDTYHGLANFTAMASRPLIGWRSPACLAQGDGETALHAWAGHHCLVPALDIGEIRQIDLVALVPPSPA